MVKTKKYILVKQFEGTPKLTDFKLVEEELPPLKNDEFLAEAVYISIDPFQKAFADTVKIGNTHIGTQVAKIIESKNPKFPVGKYVVGEFGMSTYTIGDNTPSPRQWPNTFIIPDLEGLPLSLTVGILGMPGITAYFGLLEICQPKAGETVVVSGAAGAVGSIVGQIAKIKGCTVIGIAGSDEKGKWLTNDLNFDNFVNYKDKDFGEKLAKLVPKGVDCYFDNVGGPISTTVLDLMNPFGRIAICGAISAYNDKNQAKTDPVQYVMLFKQLKMEGFIFHRWIHRWFEGFEQLKKWVLEGKLKYKETVVEGFENTVTALINMLEGGNYGKVVVKI